eukprot:GHRQ01018020.1.p2 GENE.GHRQ01018020.1~~GHRQ01018020.1.p2  ORF type:complete len:151 (+),score=66.40 GHRQ01018020.1:319-771(+)
MASQSAPPPWLGRMMVLGLPPGWMQRQPAGAAAGEPFMGFIMGSDDEGDADAEAGAAARALDGQQQSADATPGGAASGGAAGATVDGGAGSAAANGKEGDASAAAEGGQQQSAQHLFPGINAPLPDGADADAWGAELEKAKYVAQMLVVS